MPFRTAISRCQSRTVGSSSCSSAFSRAARLLSSHLSAAVASAAFFREIAQRPTQCRQSHLHHPLSRTKDGESWLAPWRPNSRILPLDPEEALSDRIFVRKHLGRQTRYWRTDCRPKTSSFGSTLIGCAGTTIERPVAAGRSPARPSAFRIS